MMTLRLGVERMLKEEIPEFEGIIEDEPAMPSFGSHFRF
jgi:Fe-S cluster biogenesis protein NfuA